MGLDIDLFRIDENRVSIRFHVPAVPSVDKEGSRISLERLFERLQNRLPILLILSGLLGVQADDIALTSDPGFFDLQGEGVLGRSSFRPNLAEPRGSGLLGKEPALESRSPCAFGCRGYRIGTNHPAIRHETEGGDVETISDSVDDGDQGRHLGGVARPLLTTEGISLTIEDRSDHHLVSIGTVIPGVALLPEGLSLFS
jgi:hypothetical protein